MRRSSPGWPDPEEDEGGFVERLKAAVSGLFGRLGGGRRQQAMPLSSFKGQSGPVVPYQERRQQTLRSRQRQHSSYALAFVVVLLVLVIGLFYGLNWALGGLSAGGRPTATVVGQGTPTPAPAGTVATLPTAAPGGTLPSPSPLSVSPTPDGTPEARTYTVKAGDTPNDIARQFGVSVEALMRANNIADPRALKIGDRLTIPPASTPTPATR